AGAGSMTQRITMRWLGTAGIRLTCGSSALLVDPYLSRNGQAQPPLVAGELELLPAEAILLSHGHFDHAADVPRLANRHRLPVHADPGLQHNLLARGVPAELLRPMHAGAALRIGEFAITPFPVK